MLPVVNNIAHYTVDNDYKRSRTKRKEYLEISFGYIDTNCHNFIFNKSPWCERFNDMCMYPLRYLFRLHNRHDYCWWKSFIDEMQVISSAFVCIEKSVR